MANPYEELDVRSVINANATLTRLGGSLMPPEVVDAMRAAGEAFVDLFELQRVVGARIAELTHNDAAYVTSGAAGGLYLSALACGLTGASQDSPTLLGTERYEVIIHTSHNNAYIPSIELAGATIVWIGSEHDTCLEELQEALGPHTAAVFFFAGAHFGQAALPLERVIEVTHAAGRPVVVDAAAQLPPPENLWRFTSELGADLAIFSGGKGLRGPQSSGLLVGRADLIELCRAQGAPNPRRGRAMKVGKEEMHGLLAAIERYLQLDHEELSRRYEGMVHVLLDAVAETPGITATRDWPSEAGQPIPRARITLGKGATGVADALWEGNPRISVATAGDEALLLNPETLSPGEEFIVAERLVAALDAWNAEREGS